MIIGKLATHKKDSGSLQWRWLLLAVPEQDWQQMAHKEFSASLPDPKYQSEWLQQVTDWECDRSKPNLYIMTKSGMFIKLSILVLFTKGE